MKQVRVVLTCDEGFIAESLRDFTIRQSMGIYNSHTERHDEIVNLVNDAMPQIREMARAI